MIPLAPVPLARHACPGCGRMLEVRGFHVPGMRCLARLECPPCRRRFYGDLPSGHGLLYPMLLDAGSGEVFEPGEGRWFADALRESYRDRRTDPVPLQVEVLRPAQEVLLLDCLDGVYGHALLKLLSTQVHLDRHPGLGLLVLVPRFLRWMVPDGAAEIWTVDLPLRSGAQWNEWLAARIAGRLEGRKAWLSLAVCLPHARDVAIERFTGVAPFAARGWDDVRRPAVTFVVREDRRWGDDPVHPVGPGRVLRAAAGRLGLGRSAAAREVRRVVRFGERLRRAWPELDLAVGGVGAPGGLPGWIADLRVPRPSAEDERTACRRYAASHLAIGVHGSSMLLPSAHAGATLGIAWSPHLGNAFQDLLVREREPRLALFRHRLLPAAVTAEELADTADSMLRLGAHANRFAAGWNDHERLGDDPFTLADGAWRREPDPPATRAR